jgi:hypothetical protein
VSIDLYELIKDHFLSMNLLNLDRVKIFHSCLLIDSYLNWNKDHYYYYLIIDFDDDLKRRNDDVVVFWRERWWDDEFGEFCWYTIRLNCVWLDDGTLVRDSVNFPSSWLASIHGNHE